MGDTAKQDDTFDNPEGISAIEPEEAFSTTFTDQTTLDSTLQSLNGDNFEPLEDLDDVEFDIPHIDYTPSLNEILEGGDESYLDQVGTVSTYRPSFWHFNVFKINFRTKMTTAESLKCPKRIQDYRCPYWNGSLLAAAVEVPGEVEVLEIESEAIMPNWSRKRVS